MKKFANCVAVRCHQCEKNDIRSFMNSVGYTFHSDCTFDDKCWLITYEDGKYAFHSHSGVESNLILDHYNEPLIRDIVSVCSNETWQMDEPKATANSYLGITGANSLYRHNAVVSEYPSFRRPTVAEICNHYGYHLEVNNIVKNVSVPTIEELDAKIDKLAAKLDDAIGAIKPCCEPETWKWFTTDGDIINTGDEVFYVQDDFNILSFNFRGKGSHTPSSDWTFFKFTSLSKEACEEYVRKNRPFEPVDVVITCNSPEELRGLWVALDVNDQTVRDSNAAKASEIGTFITDTYKWWSVVNELLIKLNLKK
jgi:hypothetical protein